MNSSLAGVPHHQLLLLQLELGVSPRLHLVQPVPPDGVVVGDARVVPRELIERSTIVIEIRI